MATSNVSLWQSTIDALVILIEDFGQNITLQKRETLALKQGEVDANVTFTNIATILAAFDTNNRGKTTFDSTSTESSITHEIYMEYRADVDSETWILYLGRRIKIIDVENIGELNGILKLRCIERGSDQKKASDA